MKKRELSRIMLAGITTGMVLAQQTLLGQQSSSASQEKAPSSNFLELVASTKGNITYRPMTEDDLLLELNQEGAELYKSLSPEGQQLALKLASRACNGMNDCRGENACATDKNKCAGLGQCKALTKCAFSDKNLAIKVAAKKMANKRQELQGSLS
ncbi:hypothetical protein [Candidatus Protochlamydia phocaeensis]|uniref:hypothetical protein n=1 Tax=Candidatus Protochlamydia phocaeensis TaxID=1414722 RepID=UPI000A9B2E15|nr:hypothetical protein [Candidatus Protochlamydia phocaeensis]